MNKEAKIFYIISIILTAWFINILWNGMKIVKDEDIQIVQAQEEIESVEYIEPPQVYIGKKVKYIQKPTKLQIQVFLDYIGEGSNWPKWSTIIETESKWDVNSQAPTYWSICDRPVAVRLWNYLQPANTFIELRDYGSGRVWQATCEEYGAKTMRTGRSHGLVHILEITWESAQCTGDPYNWHDELRCAKKIKDLYGWRMWSYII